MFSKVPRDLLTAHFLHLGSSRKQIYGYHCLRENILCWAHKLSLLLMNFTIAHTIKTRIAVVIIPSICQPPSIIFVISMSVFYQLVRNIHIVSLNIHLQLILFYVIYFTQGVSKYINATIFIVLRFF